MDSVIWISSHMALYVSVPWAGTTAGGYFTVSSQLLGSNLDLGII